MRENKKIKILITFFLCVIAFFVIGAFNKSEASYIVVEKVNNNDYSKMKIYKINGNFDNRIQSHQVVQYDHGHYGYYESETLSSDTLKKALDRMELNGGTGNGSTIINRIKKIDIEESVNQRDGNPFKKCINLESISVEGSEDGSSLKFYAKKGVLFAKDTTYGKSLVCYPRNRAGTAYVVPSGTKRIGPDAFSLVSKVTNVRLP